MEPDNQYVIDAGNNTHAVNAGLLLDQRGENYTRILGSAVDIGAVEANVVQPTPSSAIVVYGTAGADGIYVGYNHLGQDVVSLDTVGGYEFPVDLSSAASLSIYALDGDDAVIVDPAVTLDATIEGGDGDDLLVGGGDDTIRGGLGADTLHGGDGDDTLYGYLDSSTYLGGDGADSLFGGAGADVLWVEYGSDIYEVDLSDDVDGANAPALTADTFETIIKDINTGFGLGWDLVGMDQLVFDPEPFSTDIRWVRSDGYLIEFEGLGETASDDNDDTASKIFLAGEADTYVRVDKFGNEFYYFEYTANVASLVKSVNRLGVGYQYSYGSHGGSFKVESVSVVRPGQASETITYDYGTDGLVETVTDPFGRVANLYYNTSDRLEQIVLPGPNPSQPTVRPTFTFEYDTAGFLSSVTDADFRETLFDMSGSGVLEITHPDGGIVTQLPALGDAYNFWRSQLGAWTEYLPEFKFKFTLDTEERSGYEVDPLGRTTSFEIDENGYLTETTDPAGQIIVYDRNAPVCQRKSRSRRRAAAPS